MSSVEVVAEQNVAVKTSFSHGIQFQCFTHARQVQRFVGQSKYKVIFTQQLSEIPEMPLEGVDDSKRLLVRRGGIFFIRGFDTLSFSL